MAELPPRTPPTNGGRDSSVTSLMYTEDKAEILWVAHERSHELEQKALTVALTAADAQLTIIQEYLKNYVDSELRKTLADHTNLVEQIRKEWAHHNEVHTAHGTAHEREHTQTQAAVSKAENTAKELTTTLGSDLQRVILAQAGLVTKDQMATEFKAFDGRLGLLERASSVVIGRDTGISTSWAVLIGALGLIATVVTIFFAVGAR
jgi:hypothetical protein